MNKHIDLPLRSMPPPLDRPDPAPGLPTLWQGRWTLVAVTLAALICGTIHAYWIAAAVYRTHVTIMLDPQTPQIIDLGSVLPGLGRDDAIRNTQTEVLRSRDLVTALVKQQNLILDPEFNHALRPSDGWVAQARDRLRIQLTEWRILPPRRRADLTQQAVLEATVTRLIRRLEIHNHPESLVFSLAIGTSDPDKSAAIVNGLAELYIADQVTDKLQANDQATGWLTERVAQLRQTLEAAEIEARTAASSYDIVTRAELSEKERTLAALRGRQSAAGVDDPLLAARIEALSVDIAAASARMTDLARMDRDVAATRILHDHFLARLKETAIQTDVQRADARILSHAPVPAFPAYPKPRLILTIAAILGLGLGALVVLVRAQWQGRFDTADAARLALGLPVLASLPQIAEARNNPLEHMLRRPDGLLAECTRDLRAGILLSDLDAPPRVISVVSAVAGEGRSTQTVLLAQSLAGWGRKVLVIEADIRGRSLATRFALSAQPGILSLLAGLHSREEAITRPGNADFDLLVAEDLSAPAADIFATGHFADFLRDMRETYDHVIIDTPPALLSADARALAALSDTAVFLVRHKRTRTGQARRALALFQDLHVPLAGLALTRMPRRSLIRQRLKGGGAWGPGAQAFAHG